LQNQLQSTTRSLDNTKTERSTVEASVQDQATQLSTLQTQLSLAKAAYETESRLLSALRERFSGQTSQIQKAREELIRAESDLSAVRVEKAEVEQSLLRDKEEVRELQRKMTETGSTIEQVKLEIEKARKDAKQQKGLLAIAKKQLSAREAEKSKVAQELQEALAEADAITKELESAETELAAEPAVVTGPNGLPLTSSPSISGDSIAFAAAQPLPGTPGSPSSNNGSLGAKSNNPFERRLATGSGSRSQSPFLPFANPSIPTPAGVAPVSNEGTTTDNLFTFDQVFGGGSGSGEEVRRAPDVDNIPSNPEGEDFSLSTPKIGESHAVTNAELSPPSSDQDLFSTPPMSALDALGAGAQSPSAEPDFLKLSHTGASSAPPSTDQPPETHTDINTSLKELDVNESDSSDEDSDDETPLATLAGLASNKVKAGKEAPASNGHVSSFEASFPPVTAAVTSPKATDAQTSNPFPPAPTQNASPFAAATSPFAALSEPAKAAGLNDFNEAFGSLPSAEPAAADDPGFDAEFDFGKDNANAFPPVVAASPSSSTAFPPPPTSSSSINKSRTSPAGSGFENAFIPLQNSTSKAPAAPTVEGLPTLPPVAESPPFSFGDAFASSLSPVAATATAAAPGQPQPSVGVSEISFESAFGSNTTQGDSGFKSTSSRISSVPQATESPSTLSTFASSSPVQGSTGTSPRDTVTFPLSQHREATPPPRMASPNPKGRTSTSSSRESGDKVKEPGRHSKLSVSGSVVLP
jgi:epidermal growth factor receptor substrate 15